MKTVDLSVAVLWDRGPVNGTLEVTNGRTSTSGFTIDKNGPARLEVTVSDCRLDPGANPTMVQLVTEKSPVTFFLRDVTRKAPIIIPQYGVAVTTADDQRTYAQIAKAVAGKKLVSGLQRIAADPEESYEAAAAGNRNMTCPTWLGVGRDMRLFRVNPDEQFGYWGYIQPAYHSYAAKLPETEEREYALHFVLGPGASCRTAISRRLDDGVLPILRSEQKEDDVTYALTLFATLETKPLSAKAVRGSDWRAAYAFTGGNMYTAADKERLNDLITAETSGREEELVCCVRVEAVNNGKVPRYAWFKAMRMSQTKAHTFDGKRGFSAVGPERVYAVHRLEGQPMPQEEMAVLLQPGQRIHLDMLVPHQPVSAERAERLAGLDLDKHLSACRDFWRAKLSAGSSVSVPEAAIDERIRAGLLHLDINTIGAEPDGGLMACVGWYAPIGSESAPMIQFYDSMGWHRLAERCLDFFLEHQRDDGFIQNFGGYQLETGPMLWTAGEHFRYTQDEAWVRRVKEKLLKSCDFLIAWRQRNKREELRGKGYGLLDGKVADPEDFFHSFMLNGLSYIGLQRVGEMLAAIDPAQSRRLSTEAAEYRQDIRQSYQESLARSPVIPLGDGTWAPAPPPWSEYRGPLALFAEGGNWFTHGGFGTRDSLIGSLYLVLGEVLEPRELGTEFMLKTHHELFTVKNAGLSQPYYVRHDWLHLLRGEVKEFLKTYYNQVTSLADRETYTFWEHYFHASQHKTHEEAWFLMQTRWMLWLEQGRTLAFLSAVPRRWLEQGKEIELNDVVSYFGKASLVVKSKVDKGVIEAEVRCEGNRKPAGVTIRLPHPTGRKAKSAKGGVYDAAGETVRVAPFTGVAKVVLKF